MIGRQVHGSGGVETRRSDSRGDIVRRHEALAGKLGLPIANVSQHLQALRRAGLVTSERDGKFVNYSLTDG